MLKGDCGQALFAVLAAFGQIPSCAEVNIKLVDDIMLASLILVVWCFLRSSDCWLFIRGTLAASVNVEMTYASTFLHVVFRCPFSSKIIQEPGP